LGFFGLKIYHLAALHFVNILTVGNWDVGIGTQRHIFLNHFVGWHESAGAAKSTTGLPDFTWCNIPKRGKFYQMATKYAK
jgi:hypothetical protein